MLPPRPFTSGSLGTLLRFRLSAPEKAAFIDTDELGAGHAVERAADQGLSVVLVSADEALTS